MHIFGVSGNLLNLKFTFSTTGKFVNQLWAMKSCGSIQYQWQEILICFVFDVNAGRKSLVRSVFGYKLLVYVSLKANLWVIVQQRNIETDAWHRRV